MSASKKSRRQPKHRGSLGVQPTLTLGQMVGQLSLIIVDPPFGGMSGTSDTSLRERIRHWTREGLLHPVKQHHAGTGRHRHYSPVATYEAAVLNAFARAGLHLVSRPYIQAALSQARTVLKKWHLARSAGHKLPPFFLVISHKMTSKSEPTASIHEETVKPDPTADIVIVVNLTQIFSHVAQDLSTEYRNDDQNAGPG
jgi:hypothetical protein